MELFVYQHAPDAFPARRFSRLRNDFDIEHASYVLRCCILLFSMCP